MYKVNIEKKTLKNKFYRNVLKTTKNMQLVIMSIPVGGDIPKEKHKGTQFIRIEQGKAKVSVSRKSYNMKADDIIIIPPHTYHYVKNTGKKDLKLYALYSPPEHKEK